jgi:predicted Fe-Mo cluster-binding NifX family protein
MKVIIPMDSKSKTEEVSDVFGRSKYFAIYNSDDKKLEFVDNPGNAQSRGAGITASQFVIDNKISKVVVSQIGPNAENVLKQGGVKIVIETGKNLEEILKSL